MEVGETIGVVIGRILARVAAGRRTFEDDALAGFIFKGSIEKSPVVTAKAGMSPLAVWGRPSCSADNPPRNRDLVERSSNSAPPPVCDAAGLASGPLLNTVVISPTNHRGEHAVCGSAVGMRVEQTLEGGSVFASNRQRLRSGAANFQRGRKTVADAPISADINNPAQFMNVQPYTGFGPIDTWVWPYCINQTGHVDCIAPSKTLKQPALLFADARHLLAVDQRARVRVEDHSPTHRQRLTMAEITTPAETAHSQTMTTPAGFGSSSPRGGLEP